jgi:tetratricopeptide (TPR) repeat protein
MLHAESDDFGGAAAHSVRSAEISRTADPRVTAYAMANTARCLLFIERDIPRAQSLLNEVEAIVGKVGGDHIEIPLGLGFLYAHRGENQRAIAELERAWQMAGREQDHWREFVAGERLVTLALEGGDLDSAQRHLDRLAPVAAKMTGGSEDVRTEALAALTRFARGEEVDVRTPIEQLRIVDSKSDLAWALTFIASIELQRGQIKDAQRDAEEALAAAELVGRASLAAVARTIIASLSPSSKTKQIIAPSLKAETFTNLSEHAKKRVREFTKEAPNGKHGRRTNV